MKAPIIERRRLLGTALGAMLTPVAAATARAGLAQPDAALWDPPLAWREGYTAGPNGRVGWRLYPGASPTATPLIVLHGGPAAGQRYMRAYAAIAAERPVLFYDQSGCGRSAAPSDLSRYTPARYVDELEALRQAFGWPRVMLLGHSWGAFLAPLYAQRHRARVTAMVLAGGAARWRDYQIAARQWLAALGPRAVAVAERGEAVGSGREREYRQLMARYYGRHLCRLNPMPAWFVAEGAKLGRNRVYAELNGPSEFQMTGRFAAIDLRPILRESPAPTLVTCGEFDEGPPWAASITCSLLPKARLHVFAGLSHMSHIEDPQPVVDRTARFLRDVVT